MAWYTQPIDRLCDCGCKKRATVEIKSSGSYSIGYFTKTCGERKAKELNNRDQARPVDVNRTTR